MAAALRIAEELGKRLSRPVDSNSVGRVGTLPQLKDVGDYAERRKLLDGAYEVRGQALTGRKILLLDDLYQSGAALDAVAQTLEIKGKVAAIFALAITRTKETM